MATTDTNLTQLIIHELTKAQYEALTPEANQLYLTPDTTDEDIASAVSAHNSSATAHSDIRNLISTLIPSQSGNNGKFLTTNGSTLSWATVDAFPSQTGNAGKFLTTNGTTVSWATVDALPSQTGQSGKFLTTDGSTASWATVEEGANKDLSNLTSAGEARLHALKGYLDEGELLTDAEGLSDVTSYAHSTFDSSKFTVTGSPTITDGVISNITKTSYIGGIPFNTANATTSWEVRFSFDLTSSPSNNPYLLWTSKDDSGMRIVCTVDDVRVVSVARVDSSMASGQHVNVIVHYDIATTTLALTIYKNGILIGTSSGTRANYANSTIYLGARPNVDYPFTQGSFNLKDLAIFIDGALVFSGNKTGTDTYTINNETILIPYTLSKTGSKIVDSAYRTQVSAVYQAYGYAPYYTLSSTDYTIPQGELYGMLGNKSKVTIRDWSVNNS